MYLYRLQIQWEIKKNQVENGDGLLRRMLRSEKNEVREV
jgi:hypothetical protein